jgi:Fur family peroxide stress response transcriptional regulator
MERVYKRSRQRESILALLMQTDSHPTADWVYSKLKPDFPGLSLGTVYRNLNILVEQGLLTRIDNGSSFDRYDSRREPHYHFVCDRCGTIVDLALPVDTALDKAVSKKTGFHIFRHRVDFFGICQTCLAKSDLKDDAQTG